MLTTRSVVVRCLTLLLGVACLAMPARAQDGERLTGGTGTFYLGSYPRQITVVDEATEQVVDAIQVSIGVPRNLTLNEDRTRFYMINSTYEAFESIDVETRQTLHTFSLSEGARRVRIRGFRVHPAGRHVLLVLDAATKLVDRFEIEPRALALYDLEQDAIVRELEWPDGDNRGSTRFLFSPDGDLLYQFGRDIVVLETEGYTEVDRWEISSPQEDGLSPLAFGFRQDLIHEEPGFFSGVFRIMDAVQNRELMGVARIDLGNRDIDFYTLGPAVPMSFALAPGRQRAYGVSSEIGHYEFWAFDLAGRRLLARQAFQGRPRMDLHVSTNGRLLYISQAGNTIDFYDAETFEYLRTLELDGDQTTGMIVVP